MKHANDKTTAAVAATAALIPLVAAELDALRNTNAAGRFPPICRSVVRSLPGNHACVDCSAPHPEWASVSYGCLLCLQCSGRHRSFGVGTSVVRSVDLDHWTADQVVALLEGGNAQLATFWERHQMGNTDEYDGGPSRKMMQRSRRYHTKAGRFYRTQLYAHVSNLVVLGPYQGREASRSLYATAATSKRQTLYVHNTISNQKRNSATMPAEGRQSSQPVVRGQ